MHSPASVSLPVPPDDDSRFDRTVSPSPAFPKETLQQCGVSRIIKIHTPSPTTTGLTAPTPTTRALINILEQAVALGYNALSLTGGEPTTTTPTDADPFLSNELEHLVTASHTLGYFNSVTTNGTHLHSHHAARILPHLDHVTISIGGKPETHDHLLQQRGAFARMQESLTVIKATVNNFGFIHTLRPDSWQILSWLTDFAMQHKASLLHLALSTRAPKTWSPIDLYRIYFSHYYLRKFAEPKLFIQLDLLHRDNIINNPDFFFHQNGMPDRSAKGFSMLFKELTINEDGDILPLACECSSHFRIGNIHSRESLSTMIERFMGEKLGNLMELYNNTFRQIMGSCDELFNWAEQIADASHQF